MLYWFWRTFAPWRAGAQFDTPAAFHAFLRRVNKRLGAVRAVLLVLAAAALMGSYAFDVRKLDFVAVIALVLVLGLSLIILQNEKTLHEEESAP